MAITKLIPAAVWDSLPEFDLSTGDDLFTLAGNDTYRPVRADVASVAVPALTAGSIDQSSPSVGDTLSVSGSNAPVGASFQWQLNGADIIGATAATLDTTGLSGGAVRRGVSIGLQGPAYTGTVSLDAGVGTPAGFGPTDWAVADTGTGGDATITLLSMPDDGGSPIQIVQYALDGGAWSPLPGSNSTGVYSVNNQFTDGVATDVAIRAVNAQGPGPGSAVQSVTTTSGASGDTTPPVLSDIALGTQTATEQPITFALSETADIAWVLTTSATKPTRAQILAGQDQTGAAAPAGGFENDHAPGASFTAPLPQGTSGTFYVHISIADNTPNVQSAIYSTPAFSITASGAPGTLSQTYLGEDSTSGTNGLYAYSFTAPAAGRAYIAIYQGWDNQGRTLSSVTAGGVAATQILAETGANPQRVWWYAVDVAAGAFDLDIQFEGNIGGTQCVAVYLVEGSHVVSGTNSNATTTSQTAPWSLQADLNTSDGGLALMAAIAWSSGVDGNASGIGVTLESPLNFPVPEFAIGAAALTGAETPRALGLSNSATTSNRITLTTLVLEAS